MSLDFYNFSSMYKVYLLLGSNMGDRQAMLDSANLELIDALLPDYLEVASLDEAVNTSEVMETEPWGFESEQKFLNAAVHYKLQLKEGYNPEAEALMILEICKDIERRLGREMSVEYNEAGERVYHNRPIDIDILLFGDHKIDCPELTVPHKLMHERDFVMIPLKEILR